jgi:serine/threonine protein kinase
LAVKILDRKKLKKKDDDAVFREVEVMKELMDVPGVIKLMDFFVSPEKFYVVQEWAEGGDVSRVALLRIVDCKSQSLSLHI